MTKTFAYMYSKKHNSLTIVDVTNPVSPMVVGGLTDDVNLNDIDDIIIKSVEVHGL